MMNEEEREKYERERAYILRNMSRSENALDSDVADFKKWEKGKSADRRIFIKFCVRHNLDERKIGIDTFIRWLNSLGYFANPEESE